MKGSSEIRNLSLFLFTDKDRTQKSNICTSNNVNNDGFCLCISKNLALCAALFITLFNLKRFKIHVAMQKVVERWVATFSSSEASLSWSVLKANMFSIIFHSFSLDNHQIKRNFSVGRLLQPLNKHNICTCRDAAYLAIMLQSKKSHV